MKFFLSTFLFLISVCLPDQLPAPDTIVGVNKSKENIHIIGDIHANANDIVCAETYSGFKPIAEFLELSEEESERFSLEKYKEHLAFLLRFTSALNIIHLKHFTSLLESFQGFQNSCLEETGLYIVFRVFRL